ncbi:ankyrin repeat protein [Aspergillus sp. HF37]|nr:ankyrin repeat protein [Aspergillus sp. HF37]
MNNVDAVASVQPALDPARNALAANVNSRSFSKPPSPKRSSIPPDDHVSTRADPAGDGDAPASPKADSEAETIIQSGRESLSPEKRRKHITHDPKRRDGNNEPDADRDFSGVLQSREQRVMDDSISDARDRNTRPSSPSQRAASPSVIKSEKTEEPHSLPNKRDFPRAVDSAASSEENRTSRKRRFSESVEGDTEEHRVHQRQQQPPPAFRPGERGNINGVTFPRPASHGRSVSPVRPSHTRTTSGPPLGGDFYKARKVPAPLVTGFHRHSSEDRQSVSSSTSGSPLPSAHLRRLASVDGASASPAKPMNPKKQRDQNGRTRLARACAVQEIETAAEKLTERPEDLNVCDNAGNTPLQIASLEGCAPIVKILLEAGCDIDTKNIDKDTPLIDAVENGHLDVVNLLLEAGANPRTVNAEGDEPYELVPSDTEEYEGIRRVLANAKATSRHNRRGDDHPVTISKDRPSRRTSASSPRESPTIGPRSPPLLGPGTKRKSVRSEVTRNDLLWTKASPENLREFASKGDIAGVANILNVGQKADTESLIAATKGGHDEVLSLLLGMGYADPDPNPLQGGSQKVGYNTPMLAAIGRGNLAVIRLLLDQPGFNPTRRMYRDLTYFELSRERKAENWEEESDLLKDAFDNYSKTKKHRKSDVSSPRRARERGKDSKRPGRRESPSPVARPRKSLGSPSRGHPRESLKEFAHPKERKREALQHKDQPIPPARPKSYHKENGDVSASDPDTSRIEPPRPKLHPSARSEPNPAPRGDEAPKRRRLIAGRPPQDRDRKVPSSLPPDSLAGRDEGSRPRADSPEAVPSKHGGAPLKRIRSSPSPEGPRSSQDSERRTQELQKKKRRVLSEDGTPNITNGSVKKSPANDNKPASRRNGDVVGRSPADTASSQKGADHTPGEDSIKEERGKHESNDLSDIPMEKTDNAAIRAKEAEAEAEERRRAELRKAEESRVAEEKRLAAEAEQARIAKEEAARAARLAREKAEEDERKRKEAEQRRIKQAEDERQKRLEQERLRLEKLRREQEEQEHRRRKALPNRLREAANLIGSNDPRARSRVWLKRFMPVVMTDTKQLDPFCGEDLADEKWVPNFLVAPLLATNDLQLSQYASWEKRNATPAQRMDLWRVTRRMLDGTDENAIMDSSLGNSAQKDCETQPRYFGMEHVFWVKLSDFMDLVPHIPHLHGLNIKLIRMSIGQPLGPSDFAFPQPNGYAVGTPPAEHGFVNGYGFPRPSTYV